MVLHSGGYRKSYCCRWSTDAELAHNVSLFLCETVPGSPVTTCHAGLRRLLDAYRGLDYLPRVTGRRLRAAIRQTAQIAKRVAAQYQRQSAMTIPPDFRIFNDNRHEQHVNVWRAA